MFWQNSMNYRYLARKAVKSPVRNDPHFTFADHSSDNIFSDILQATLLYWPIANHYRNLTLETLKSPVRISFLCPSCTDQSTDKFPANVPQVTSRSWPIASQYRNSRHRELESMVRAFSHPSFVNGLVCRRYFCDCFPGDIAVLAYCKSLQQFDAENISAITGKNVPTPSNANQNAKDAFAGDIEVFQNTPSLQEINIHGTKVTGENILYHSAIADQSDDEVAANGLQVTSLFWRIVTILPA